MEKQEILRNSIKSNPNILEEFKCNIGTLTDMIVTILPDYDYSNYETILSSLKLDSDNSLDSYSSYDRENNVLKINLEKSFDDRIDLQHLFLHELLKMNFNSNTPGFNNGMAEVIGSLMNSDESMKKLYPLESLAVSLLSKVVDPAVLLDGYMNNDIGSILLDIEQKGITSEEFTGVIQKFDTIDESFPEVEIMISNMYAKKVKTNLDSGVISYDDISSEFDQFEDMLITKKSELMVLYPHHDFSKMEGLSNVKSNLDLTIINIEDMQMIDTNERVK